MDHIQTPKYFSIIEGGPFYRLLGKAGLNKNSWKLVLVVLCITWLPLLILTAADGKLYSGDSNFLNSAKIHMRFLLALPMLFIIRFVIDEKIVKVTNYLSLLVFEEERDTTFLGATNKVKKLIHSWLPEIILLLLVVIINLSPLRGGAMSMHKYDEHSWMFDNSEGNSVFSFAGKWFVYFSIPFFQFVWLRWMWRYIVWVIFLFYVSKMKLNLQPTHPDSAGGIRIIIIAQKYFGLFFFAINLALSGELMAQLQNDPHSFSVVRSEGIAYVILCIILLLFPLAFYIGQLLKVKYDGLIKMSHVGTSLSGEFRREWVKDIPIEKRASENLVSANTQQDFSTVFVSLENFKPFPIKLKDVTIIVVTLLIPYVPILFIRFSVAELVQKLIGMLV